ncbi:SH3 domain-containing protein [Ochromonadaceae sp. CCMP2298]|jgi:hypothetical protein|nr:SH3 domain-containing protein [Ochromonadaceae sp. CCMP2298]
MSSNEELLVAVLYDYDASDLDELTIRKGDLLFILEQYDDGWCLVRSDVSSGLIPSNYVREEGLEPVEQARDTTSKRQSNSRVGTSIGCVPFLAFVPR